MSVLPDPVIDDPGVRLFVGDAVALLPLLDAASADSVVTDPPYGLEFAGQAWDGAAGFRDSLAGVDTAGMSDGEVFETWCAAWAAGALRVLKPGGHLVAFGGARMWHRMARGVEAAGFELRDQIAWLYSSGMPKSLDLSAAADKHLGAERPDRMVVRSQREGVLGRTSTVVSPGQPVTVEAKRLVGWGTGLKPGFEPILIARKPPEGSLVANAVKHGTGGLNIDAARFGASRWPVNVALDAGQAELLDGAVGDGASKRFPVFHLESKPSRLERPRAFGGAHATVKPVSLMRWLTRLVTPPGGLVVEPFAGSGTTIEAALSDGFKVVAVEKDEEFVALVRSRLDRAGLG